MPEIKIVLNKRHGGFGISIAAAEFMAARGNEQATKELEEYKNGGCKFWFGYNYKRDDPDLIAALEELGSEVASGPCAKLEFDWIYIPEIEDFIKEHAGLEWVE